MAVASESVQVHPPWLEIPQPRESRLSISMEGVPHTSHTDVPQMSRVTAVMSPAKPAWWKIKRKVDADTTFQLMGKFPLSLLLSPPQEFFLMSSI